MNISEAVPSSSHGHGSQLKGPRDQNKDSPASKAHNDINEGFQGEKEWVEGPEVISLDFSDGVWQKAGSADSNTNGGFSRFTGDKERKTFGDDFTKDKTYYNREGVLVIREELKGRYVDGIF